MVFVARMLRVSNDLHDYKIILINDRLDLEEQLTATAQLIGGRVNVIESNNTLRKELATNTSDINMVMAHKFLVAQESLPYPLLKRWEPTRLFQRAKHLVW